MSSLYNLLELGHKDDYQMNLQITRIFKLCVLDNNLSWTIDDTECIGKINRRLAEKLRLGQVIATQCMMRLFEDGPKYLTMKARDFEALENTDLTIPIKEYQQPFPVVCFPIPEDYAKDRFIQVHEKVRIPKYAIIWRRPDMILATVVYARDFIWATYIISAFEGHTFEQKLEEITVGEHIEGTEADLDVLKKVCRACLNGALVFDQVKTTSFSTTVAKGSKMKSSIYFSFDQCVKLYSREGDGDYEPGDGEVKPHWRRGHWREQACGPNLSLRKRIRIAPVLVRKDKFGGELQEAKASYTK